VRVEDNRHPRIAKRDELPAFPRTVNIFSGVLLSPFMDYVQKDLGYATDRPYTQALLRFFHMRERRA
jgi:hypothetical protein